MRKVIDLCLDMPMGADSITQTLRTMCLDPNYSGYKHTYAAKIAEGIGLNISDLDTIAHQQGEDKFMETVFAAAKAHEVTPADFVHYMDTIGGESRSAATTTTERPPRLCSSSRIGLRDSSLSTRIREWTQCGSWKQQLRNMVCMHFI